MEELPYEMLFETFIFWLKSESAAKQKICRRSFHVKKKKKKDKSSPIWK